MHTIVPAIHLPKSSVYENASHHLTSHVLALHTVEYPNALKGQQAVCHAVGYKTIGQVAVAVSQPAYP